MSLLSPDNPGTSFNSDRLPSPNDDSLYNITDWVDEIFPNQTFIGGETHERLRGVCRELLTATVPFQGIRYWDLIILLANALFLLFMVCKLRSVRTKMRRTKSPVFKAFIVLICLITLLNLLRCLLSIALSTTLRIGELVDKILWVSLKFFSLTAELCVLSFGLLFGHLDSGSSIRRALLLILVISLVHSATQSVLEFKLLNRDIVDLSSFDIHQQGGIAFWTITSVAFAFIYVIVLLLPVTCFRYYVTLPSKSSFVVYCCVLALLNLMQAFGASLLFFDLFDGVCVVDFTSFIYFTMFAPLVYFTFIRKTLKNSTSVPTAGGLFSYRQQKDERGAGEMVDSYYPRFSGLQSPSYDDLFEATRENRYPYPYDAPLMLNDTADSTVTTRTGSDDYERRYESLDRGPRHLKGLGAHGTLVFNDDTVDHPYPPPWSSYRY